MMCVTVLSSELPSPMMASKPARHHGVAPGTGVMRNCRPHGRPSIAMPALPARGSANARHPESGRRLPAGRSQRRRAALVSALEFFRRKRHEASPKNVETGTVDVDRDYSVAVRTGPVGFGYKIAWLAIRTEDTKAAAEALRLTNAHAVSWAEGIDAAYGAQQGQAPVFLTPVVDGWTLAVLGRGELFEDDGAGGGALDLSSLSNRFGEVQKFATHRVVEYQEWQRWVNGSPVRRYCWIGESGEIRFDEGEPVSAEGNLLRAMDLDGDWDPFDFADEETVMAVAAEWSINPTTLDDRDNLSPLGLLGTLAQRSQV
jgi:hypothetical protein